MLITIFLSLVMTSLVISLLIVIFAFFSRAFPRLMSSCTRYAVWVIILFSLLLPVRPLLGRGFFAVKPPHMAEQTAVVQTKGEAAASASAPADSGLPVVQLLFYAALAIWLLGGVVYLIRHVSQYLKLRRLIQRVGTEVEDTDTLELFDNLMDYMQIRNKERLRLVSCHFVSSPMLTGFRHPVILLPKQDFTLQQLEVILEHELTHYQHRDLLINLLMIVATSLHWFNPIVRFSNQVIQEEGEIFCDESVLRGKNLDYRRFYGKTILSLIEKGEPQSIALSTCFFESKMNLQHRLIAILDMHNPMKRLSYLTLLAMAACIFLSSSVLVFATELKSEPGGVPVPIQRQKKPTEDTAKSQSSSSSSSSQTPAAPSSSAPAASSSSSAAPSAPQPSQVPVQPAAPAPAAPSPAAPAAQAPAYTPAPGGGYDSDEEEDDDNDEAEDVED